MAKQGNTKTTGTVSEAQHLGYEPKTPGDWTAIPNNAQDAFDELRGAAGEEYIPLYSGARLTF